MTTFVPACFPIIGGKIRFPAPKNTENTLSQEKTIAPVDQNITIVDPITTTDQEELQPIDDNEEGKTKASENFLAKLNKFLSKYIGETDDE